MSNKTTDILNTTFNFIEKMILLEKINLLDVPFEIRILSKSMYIYACRVSRNYGRDKYTEILNLLKNDIELASDNSAIKEQLLRLYDDLNNNSIYVEERNDSVEKEEKV